MIGGEGVYVTATPTAPSGVKTENVAVVSQQNEHVQYLRRCYGNVTAMLR